MNRFIFIFFILILSSQFSYLSSQPLPLSSQPSALSSQRVALVLSGGGSKGLAHIGVLKALEDSGIPINYIAGTSIGAIVGGLYASGYSPDSIEKIFLSSELIDWAKGNIDDKYFYYFKKPEPDASWLSAQFDYNKGWVYSLPANIISPAPMDFAFNELFAGASAAASYDFNQLFIPFRCVASDINENRAEVLAAGDVGKAIRASMSYPFYFKPVKIKDKLLFDGGMYNNFPSDVVLREFDPDIIIGSQVTRNESPPQENDIMSQIYNMLMNKTDYNVICENSVMIQPDIPPNYKVIDFSRRQEYIDSGYTATIKKIKDIRHYVTDRVSKADVEIKRNEFNIRKPALIIDKISVSGLNKYQKVYVQKSLFHRADKVFLSEFKKNYFKLIADEKIDYIFPEMTFNKQTACFDINLDITKKKRFAAQFGGILSSSPVNEAFVGLQYNSLSAKAVTANVNSYFGRFYNSVQGAVRIDFPSSVPLYLRATTSYSQYNYFKTQTYFIGDKSPSYLVRDDTHSDACIGFPARNNGRFEAGATVAHLRSDYYQTNYFTRLDTTDRNFFDLIAGHLLFDRNTLKNKQFSSLGTRLLGKLNYVVGKETNYPGSTSVDTVETKKTHYWYQLRLSYENFFGHFGWYRLGLYSELHLSNQTLFTNYTASMLAAPAFEPVPESKTIFNPRFRAYNFAGFGLKNLFIINKNFDFRIEAYAFQPYEEILARDDMTAYLGKRFERRYFMGMAALVFQTPVGPISLCLNYYDKAITHVNKFTLMFSFGYLIFNPKAIE